MLSSWDDLLVHQAVAPVRQAADNDPRWYDRYWFNIHDLERRVVLSCGMGVYPNQGVVDGFAGVIHAERQTNLRLSRELGPDRSRTEIGPFRIAVREGLRELHLSLADNDMEIAFDVTFTATAPPHARLPMMHLVRDGRVINHTCHFNQPGRAAGWVSVGGQRFEVSPDRWWAVRDHSWGIRDGVGGPPNGAAERPTGGEPARWRPANPFVSVQFPDQYLFILGEGRTGASGELIATGGPDARRMKIPRAEFQMTMRPGTIALESSEVNFEDEHGAQQTLTVRPWATFHLAGGGYGGYNGFWHGRPRGAYHQEGEVWDLANAETPRRIAGRDDHVIEARLGDRIGYGVFEVGLRGREPYAPFDPQA